VTENKYRPIDCSVHDMLESTAVRRTVARFVVRGEDGTTSVIQDRIDDLFARDGAEYMRTAGGQEIRLDRLASVNDETVRYEPPAG
jgi:Rho-binding antiterminator